MPQFKAAIPDCESFLESDFSDILTLANICKFVWLNICSVNFSVRDYLPLI